MNWLTDIYNMVKTVFNSICAYMDELVDALESVTFAQNTAVTKTMGTIHYVVDTPMYILLCTIFWVGAAFTLYGLGKIAIKTIAGLIPGLKGKIVIE